MKPSTYRTGTKGFVLSLGLLALFSPTVFAQTTGHPFEDLVGQKIESNNIFLLWQEGEPGNKNVYQKVYRLRDDAVELPDDERLVGTTRSFDGRPASGSQQMVVASGEFNEDPYEDLVAAWEGEDQSIELLIPHMDSTESIWTTETRITVEGPIIPVTDYIRGRILLDTGDFDGDGLDEFVLLYQGADEQLHLELYDSDGTLAPELKVSTVVAEVPSVGLVSFTPAAMAVGDLDGDGRDEITVAGLDPDGGPDGRWTVFFNTYEFIGGNTLHLLGEHLDYQDPGFDYTRVQFSMEAGRFRDVGKDEIAFAWSFDVMAPAPNTDSDTFVYLMSYDSNDNTFSRNDRIEMDAVKDSGQMDPIAMASGDLNADGFDELAIQIESDVHVYSVDNFLNYVSRSQFTLAQTFGTSYDYLAIADVNQDLRDDVIVSRSYAASGVERLSLSVYSMHNPEDGWSRERIASIVDEIADNGTEGYRRFAIAAGGFDGYRFTLGEPIHSVATDMSQPLVILNAPPIHFDIFDDTVFDVNRCYSGDGCAFSATYEESTTELTEVSTEVKKDWGASAGAGVSGEITAAPMGVGITTSFKAYFDATYGKNFSLKEEEGETITVSIKNVAIDDDLIYATVTDYDIWEYPVYYGTEEFPRRYIMVADPDEPQGSWFKSKSWSANAYIPDHEVGNILSYPAYEDVSGNPNIDQFIAESNTTFGLDANTEPTWSFTRESWEGSTADTTRELGFNSGLELGGFRASGKYNDSDMSTHKTSVKEGLRIEIEFGGIDRSFGENRYDVTPYAYWAKNGALVIDYAVMPELSSSGGSNTWWEVRYGHAPDPSFVLPWRYDPEKGFGISEEAKRHQTQDVIFDRSGPEAGDTLTLTARVRNFSLVGTSAPVTAHFYVGDPDDGGVPILGSEGETFASTEEAIPAQRWADAVMQWAMPADLPNNPRIYAVLDQDATTPEIHANNNKGFNILRLSGTGTPIASPEDDVLPDVVELHAAYPNPFNPSTVIEYTIGTTGNVVLEVYNVLGQRVETLQQGVQTAGRHRMDWNASSRASGVYFVTLRANSVTQTRKVILIE